MTPATPSVATGSPASVRAVGEPVEEPGTPSYPRDFEHDVVWSDGVTCRVRPIRPDDGHRLRDFHAHLSTRSAYLRFFTIHPELSAAEVERFTHVDYDDRLALVAEREGLLIAVARYDRIPGSDEAEVAFVVTDDYQHHGIGTLLLDDLAEVALRRGITTFVASTLAENSTMLGVFKHSGFQVTSSRDHETISLRFSVVPDDRYRAALAARQVAYRRTLPPQRADEGPSWR
jgi:GNAT superfamily N-acetyltransferase